jgi:hypothetical protein
MLFADDILSVGLHDVAYRTTAPSSIKTVRSVGNYCALDLGFCVFLREELLLRE